MGLPGCGKTSLLREIMSDYQQIEVGNNYEDRYWYVPYWTAALIGARDDNPDYTSYSAYRAKSEAPGFNPAFTSYQMRQAAERSSHAGHDGVPEKAAVKIIDDDEYNLYFAEGYLLQEELEETCILRNIQIVPYWIDISMDTAARRMNRFGETLDLRHVELARKQWDIAQRHTGWVIDGEQQFEAVEADLLTRMLMDVQPLEVLGKMEEPRCRRIGPS